MEILKKYVPILISVFIFFTTIFIFLYNEKFDKNLPFDAGKFGTIVAIFGVILNSLTIFLLYKQIQEMALARKEANQPDLHVKSLTFITEDRLTDNKLLPVFLKMEEGRNFKVKTASLHNIGLSTAKSIKLKWNYDSEEVEKYLYGIYESSPFKNFSKNYTYDFIISNTSCDVVLPYHFLMLYGEKGNLKERDVPNIVKPKLKLSLEYYDIYENPYHKTINVSVVVNENQIHLNFTL